MKPKPSALTHRLSLSLRLPLEGQFLLDGGALSSVLGGDFLARSTRALDVEPAVSLAKTGLAPELALVLSCVAFVRTQTQDAGEHLLVLIQLDLSRSQELGLAQLAAFESWVYGVVLEALQVSWAVKKPGQPFALSLSASRHELKLDLKGHAWGQEPRVHYVVQTDVQEGWMPEIEAWYDNEHMPGLAGVPGCISAKRFINHDGGPLSVACYDLDSASVLTSGPWMAVRGTAWSALARPHFVNPERHVMHRL
jgi:hypothetical protein